MRNSAPTAGDRLQPLRSRLVAMVAAALCSATLVGATAAVAYYEDYAGTICRNNCHIQNPGGAHTFAGNYGQTYPGSGIYLACQLYNSSYNRVGHGYSDCAVGTPSSGQYVHARVYNQEGGAGSDSVAAIAIT